MNPLEWEWAPFKLAVGFIIIYSSQGFGRWKKEWAEFQQTWEFKGNKQTKSYHINLSTSRQEDILHFQSRVVTLHNWGLGGHDPAHSLCEPRSLELHSAQFRYLDLGRYRLGLLSEQRHLQWFPHRSHNQSQASCRITPWMITKGRSWRLFRYRSSFANETVECLKCNTSCPKSTGL